MQDAEPTLQELVDIVNKMKKRTNDATLLALNIDRLMRRIHAELHPRAADFDHHQVGPLGGMLLLTVGEHGSIDIQSVVDLLGRDKSQISRLIQRFERKGLLTREKSATDARVSVLSLTKLGKEQVESIKDVLTVIVDGLFNALPAGEKATFAKTLERVLAEDEG